MSSVVTVHQIRVFVRVRAKKTHSRVGFRPLNQPRTNAGPVCFDPTRTCACSLGVGSARVLSARLDVYDSSAPTNPAARIGGLVGRVSSSAYRLGITIIYRFQDFRPF